MSLSAVLCDEILMHAVISAQDREVRPPTRPRLRAAVTMVSPDHS
jgi:hypothetical protein